MVNFKCGYFEILLPWTHLSSPLTFPWKI
jgi:hypothetical protein